MPDLDFPSETTMPQTTANYSRRAVYVFAIALAPILNHSAWSDDGRDDHAHAAKAAKIARALVTTLGHEAQREFLFPFDVAERRRWRRDPARRPGIALKDMTDQQRDLVDQMLATALSDHGQSTVRAIRAEQDLLREQEEGLGAGFFWIAIYGDPGRGRWAWRFGGHHISLHLTYDGLDLIAATPLHLGGEIAGTPRERWSGYLSLSSRESLAHKIIESLPPQQRELSRFQREAPPRLELSEPAASPLVEPDRGIAVAAMASEHRAVVIALIDEYIKVFQSNIATQLAAKLKDPERRTRFAWAGSEKPGQPTYYRIQGVGSLIEYSNTGSHIHTIVRTESDFGKASM